MSPESKTAIAVSAIGGITAIIVAIIKTRAKNRRKKENHGI